MNLKRNAFVAIVLLLGTALNLRSQSKPQFEKTIELPKALNKTMINETYELGTSYAFVARRWAKGNQLFIIDKSSGEELYESEYDLGSDGFITEVAAYNGKLHVFVHKKVDESVMEDMGGYPQEIWEWIINDRGEVVSKKPFISFESSPIKNPYAFVSRPDINRFVILSGYIEGTGQNRIMLADSLGNILQSGTIEVANSALEFIKMARRFLNVHLSYIDFEGNFYVSSKDSYFTIYRRVNNFESENFNLPEDELPVGCAFSGTQIMELNEDTILITTDVVKLEDNDVGENSTYAQTYLNKKKEVLIGSMTMVFSQIESRVLSHSFTFFNAENREYSFPTVAEVDDNKIVLEQYVSSKTYLLPNSKFLKVTEMNLSTPYNYYADYLVLACYHADGSLLWIRPVDKWQGKYYAMASRETFESYDLSLRDGKLILLFQQGNVPKSEIGKLKGHVSTKRLVKKANLKMYSLDLKTGEFLAENSFSQEACSPYSLMPTYGYFGKPRFKELFLFYDWEAKRNVLGRLSFN
ncbi:hypothetical protein [Croceimicrobium hydrocarbonivorans]|uniref:Uncharacterized protein n=1 Tax=Croceimicrobium hydrocarbonivorans TaxID=2761580 RepID=A0A7H0VGK0_9FLAO|nr:hypothetical protein [Croceimicrobium hydrocarbonivorans]QNR24848.1 hypothetical protein H4K34_03125 [Croceimicrobium hydrocarbonivorans]